MDNSLKDINRKIIIMIPPNSLVRQKEGGRGRGGRSKKGKTNRNSDARRGYSHRSLPVRSVGCEEQEVLLNIKGRAARG